jgi:hypothetical protein
MTAKRDEALHSAELEEGCNVMAVSPARLQRSNTHRAVEEAIRNVLVARGYAPDRAQSVAAELAAKLPRES